MREVSIRRASSATLFTFTIVLLAIVMHLRRKYLQRELWFGPALTGTIIVATAANLAAQFANTFGIFSDPNSASYFFRVVWLLLFATLVFARIIFIRPPSA
jgi:xanthine/uracil permease